MLRSYPIIFTLTLVATYFVGIHQVRLESKEIAGFQSDLRSVSIMIPDFRPTPGQADIDLALALFSIELPNPSAHPTFDPTLADRGLTKRKLLTSEIEVTIGPAAFQNWSILASTLAHELEVHGRQSVVAITFMDIIGARGTDIAERQAYLYEMTNSARFGLRAIDQRTIRETMDYFYPVTSNNRLEAVQNLFARALLQPSDESSVAVVAPAQSAVKLKSANNKLR